MRPMLQGNGSGKLDILLTDMGGWVRVFPSKGAGTSQQDLGIYLSQTLTQWFRERPQLRMKAVMPITRDGTTVELHGWYEVHVVPPAAGAPQPSEQGPT